MSNMYGRIKEVFGKSYDKGRHGCQGAGGSADWNLFPPLRSLNRGWSDEGKLYREMEAYLSANPGTMCFSIQPKAFATSRTSVPMSTSGNMR